MTENLLISIIIPVYNSAEYLQECIDSVVSQSYQNLEIILINDGSTDNSGDICDIYAWNDARIKVIHQHNCGPSVARNVALDTMQGKYVTFIDSDDTIHPCYIETLYNNMTAYNADISSTRLYTSPKHHHDKNTVSGNINIYSSIEAVKHILYQNVLDSAVAGKLYKSELWKQIRFKTNIYYEDLDVFYLIYFKASHIVHIDCKMYYYRQHSSSRMGCFSLKRTDVLDVTDGIVDYITLYHPELLSAAKDRKFSANMNIFWLMSASGISNEKTFLRCWQNIKSLRFGSLLNPNVRIKNKIGALASLGGRRFLRCLFSFFK